MNVLFLKTSLLCFTNRKFVRPVKNQSFILQARPRFVLITRFVRKFVLVKDATLKTSTKQSEQIFDLILSRLSARTKQTLRYCLTPFRGLGQVLLAFECTNKALLCSCIQSWRKQSTCILGLASKTCPNPLKGVKQ